MLEAIVSLLTLIPILLFYGIGNILVLGSFMMPILHWNDRQDNRKAKTVSMSKIDYVQEFSLVVVGPIILMALGVTYIIQRS